MVTINSKQKIDVIIPCLKNNMKDIFKCYCEILQDRELTLKEVNNLIKNCLKEII